MLTFFFASAENMDSYHNLIWANEKGEWMWQFYFKAMIIAFIPTVIFALMSVLACMAKHGQFNAEYLYHPFKVV